MIEPEILFHLAGRDAYELADYHNEQEQKMIDQARIDAMHMRNLREEYDE